MVGVAQIIVTLIENWKTVLKSNQEVLGTVYIKRGIIQGDSLSPLLFVILMIPLSLKGYKSWLPSQERRMQDPSSAIMDDLKLYRRNSNQITL